MEVTPIDNIDTWGLDEVESFVPPIEVIEAVLENPEVQIEYPEVFEQALRLKRESEKKQ